MLCPILDESFCALVKRRFMHRMLSLHAELSGCNRPGRYAASQEGLARLDQIKVDALLLCGGFLGFERGQPIVRELDWWNGAICCQNIP